MPTLIMQHTYNMSYIGHVLPPKETQVLSQYSSHHIQIGTKTSTHTPAHSHTHIAHFHADTITYEEPTIPPKLNIPRKELSTLQILCIHHQNNYIGTYEQLNELTHIVNNL